MEIALIILWEAVAILKPSNTVSTFSHPFKLIGASVEMS